MNNSLGKTRQPRERNSILKKYYGISPNNAEKTNPLNIDDPTFDALKYFAKLVKEQPLNGLIKNDNIIVSEMREIDGDMKTLVYENYSKFISATDTIRKMKSNVESMESEMGRLEENIQGIAQQCTKINQALEPNRTKIQQLGNVHNQLQRLQFIFDLPDRLEHCLNTKHYAQAVKYYTRARKLLDHYQHMPAFKGIERDCCSIMNKIKDELWSGMKQQDVATEKVNEFAKLLVLLKEDPEALWNTYIEVQMGLLTKHRSSHTTTGTSSNADDLATRYILPLENLVRHFQSFFLSSRSRNDGSSECDTGSVVNMASHDQERAKSDLLRNIQPCIDELFDMISSFVNINSLDNDDRSGSQLIEQMQYLSDLQHIITTRTPSLSTVALLDQRLVDFVATWQNGLINNLMKSVPLEMKDRIESFSEKHLLTKEDTFMVDGHTMRSFLDDITIWFGRHIKKDCFLTLQSCLQITADNNQNLFLSRIQAGLKKMWISMADHLSNIPTANHSSTAQVFMVSRLCYDFADYGIIQTYNDLSGLLYRHGQEENEQVPPYPSSLNIQMDTTLVTDAHSVMDHYLIIGQRLLNDKVMQDGYQLSSDVQQCYLAYDSLDIFQPPTKVSSAWLRTLNRLLLLEHILRAIFPQTSAEEPWHGGTTTTTTRNSSDNDYDYRYGSATPGGGDEPYLPHDHSSHSLATQSSSLAMESATQLINQDNGNNISNGTTRHAPFERKGGGGNDRAFNVFSNIDKLFAERVDIYRSVDPSARGVCGGLVRILIKAFHETTRLLQAMDEHLYHQLQLDIEFIQRTLWTYTTDETWFTTILQDVNTGAYLRCHNPAPMSIDVSDNACKCIFFVLTDFCTT
ncbi:exocyst complex component Sec5-domain-containing protein [Chlamydoabsidia padenii]|nr:exocyst complex component Sec5-domain-containing protein [Chlamydoabsidia padenii]